MRTLLLSLILLVTACRRPSRQLADTFTPPDKPTQAITRTVDVEPPDYRRYLKAGDDIVVLGNAPTWTLAINSTKNQLRFKSAADSITVPLPARQEGSNGGFRYEATVGTGAEKMVVGFTPDSCVNAVLGQRGDYQVDVDLRGKRYVGCGLSLQHLARLQDIWVLTTFRGQSVLLGNTRPDSTRPDGPRLDGPRLDGPRLDGPRLEISLTERRVTGTTGCNRLSGPVEADSRRILFGPLVTTRMACAGEVGRFESDFLEAMSLPLTYKLADLTLTLLHDNKPIMTFKKVD